MKLQLETKETLISFQKALQILNSDLIKKYIHERVTSDREIQKYCNALW